MEKLHPVFTYHADDITIYVCEICNRIAKLKENGNFKEIERLRSFLERLEAIFKKMINSDGIAYLTDSEKTIVVKINDWVKGRV